MFNSEDDEIIGYLEDQGAVIWEGQAENGEAVFKFDLEKLKIVMPELYEEIMSDIDQDLMELYKAGMVEIEYDEDLNAMFRMSKKAEEFMRKLGKEPPTL